MSEELWNAGLPQAPNTLPPGRPDQFQLASLPEPPVEKRPRRTLFRVIGGICAGFGGLLALGVAELMTRAIHPAAGILAVEFVLGACMIAGGIHFLRHGWREGHDLVNVLSILPAAVFVALVVLGGAVWLTQPKPATDSFGYTSLDRQAFVQGCGGGARCSCLFKELERTISHDRFMRENETYMQTGSFSPEMQKTIVDMVANSSCV